MANNKHNTPNPEEGDKLLSYLNGGLNNADKHKLEEQMLDDAFLADAAEGLAMANKQKAATHIAAINAAISGKADLPAAKRSYLQVVGNTAAIAATVALLIAAAWFISQYANNGKQSMVAESKKESITNNGTVNDAGVQMAPLPNEIENKADSNTATKAPIKSVPIQTIESDAYSIVEDMPTPSYSNAPPVIQESPAEESTTLYAPTNVDMGRDYSYNKEVIEKNKVKAPKKSVSKKEQTSRYEGDMEQAPGVYMDGILIKPNRDDKTVISEGTTTTPTGTNNPIKTTTTSPTAYPDMVNKGMASYNNGDYKSALEQFEKLLKTDATNAKAIYYAGMSNGKLGRQTKAIEYFNKVAPGTTYYENALWEKAQLYKAQKNNTQATLALQEIIKLNGTLKNRAQEMLNKLNK
jgi:tetratricopeptide (TPR) repeat protein